MQNDFMEKYYNEFDDSEENKFIYTDIHREYVSTKKEKFNVSPAKHSGSYAVGITQASVCVRVCLVVTLSL